MTGSGIPGLFITLFPFARHFLHSYVVVYISLTFNLAGTNSISCRTNFFPTGTSLLLQTGHTSSDSGSVIITSICGNLDSLSSNCPLYFFFLLNLTSSRINCSSSGFASASASSKRESCSKPSDFDVSLFVPNSLRFKYSFSSFRFLFSFWISSNVFDSATTADCICRYNSL